MFFGKLLPKEGNFFELFNQHAEQIVKAAHAFSQLVAHYSDPLPQSLVLTAIVIGFATTGFVIELALRSHHESGTDHVDGKEPGA